MTYEIHVKEIKRQSPRVKLKDLSPTACFIDQYGCVFMRLADNIECTIASGQKYEISGIIWCVAIKAVGHTILGQIYKRNPEDEVNVVESSLELRIL